MSEYTFGDMSYSGGQPQDGQHSGSGEGQEAAPKWFREYMTAAKQQNADLRAQVDLLTAEKRNTEMGNAFEAKGFSRTAAALYQGEPDKVDEWLSAHGDALARVGQQPQEGQRPPGEVPAQPAASVVPQSVQADLQKMQQMGQPGAGIQPANSDDDLAAALRATTNPDEFFQVAKANGWQFDRSNLGPL